VTWDWGAGKYKQDEFHMDIVKAFAVANIPLSKRYAMFARLDR
jgi:hypothetical protein